MSYELGCITDQIQVLHPCHKLAYFRKLKWPLDWINLAETLVRDEFERNYTAIFDNVEDEEDDNDNEASPKPKVSHSAPVCYFFIDTLAWWYEKRAMFPQLSRMALDYLSIPGECGFVLASSYHTLTHASPRRRRVPSCALVNGVFKNLSRLKMLLQ